MSHGRTLASARTTSRTNSTIKQSKIVSKKNERKVRARLCPRLGSRHEAIGLGIRGRGERHIAKGVVTSESFGEESMKGRGKMVRMSRLESRPVVAGWSRTDISWPTVADLDRY